MKKSVATFIAIIIMVASLHAVRLMRQSAVTGYLLPLTKNSFVWAVKGHDSLKVIPARNGSFTLLLSPGDWVIKVPAVTSGRSVSIKIKAEEGKNVSLGVISRFM